MMSPILTLLNTSAVPFQFPADYPIDQPQGHRNIAARRRQRGLPCIIAPQPLDLENLGISVRSNQEQIDASNQRALMAAVLNEAAKTIEYVIGPEDAEVFSDEPSNQVEVPDESISNSAYLEHDMELINPRMYNTPRAPPNSPSYNKSEVHFSFPHDTNGRSADEEEKSFTSIPSNQPDEPQHGRLRRTRSMRKRRRKSSFKDPSVQPRVAPKISPQPQNLSTMCSDADDEGSDQESRREVKKKSTSRSTPKHCHKLFSYHHKLNDKGLAFGLELVAQTQKLSSSSSSDSSDQTDGKPTKFTDWSKVGEELRSIADSFQESNGGTNVRVEATLTGVVPMDLLSILNMMLPVSIPQSLWSALVSYAAWKIFKRFQ